MLWESFLTILLFRNSFGDALLISVSLVSLRSFSRSAISVLVRSALEAHSFSRLHQLMSSGNNGMQDEVHQQCISLSPHTLSALAEFLEVDPAGTRDFFLSEKCVAQIRSGPSVDRWTRILPPDLRPRASGHKHLQQVLKHCEELDAQSRWMINYPLSSLPWAEIIRHGEEFHHTFLFSDTMHLVGLASYCDNYRIGGGEVVRVITMLEKYSLANASDITRALPPVVAIVLIVMKRDKLREDRHREDRHREETLCTIVRAGNALRNLADTVVQPDTFEHALLCWAGDTVRYKGAVTFNRNLDADAPTQLNLSMEKLLPMVEGKSFAALCLWTVLFWNLKGRSTAVRATRISLSRAILLTLNDSSTFAKYLHLLRSLRAEPISIARVLGMDEITEKLIRLPPESIPQEIFPQPPRHMSFILEYARRWIFTYDDGWYDRLRAGRQADEFLEELLQAGTIPYATIPPYRMAAYGGESTEKLLRTALEFALNTTQTFMVYRRTAEATARAGSTLRPVIAMRGRSSPYHDVIIVDLIILLTLHYSNPPYRISECVVRVLDVEDKRRKWASIFVEPL